MNFPGYLLPYTFFSWSVLNLEMNEVGAVKGSGSRTSTNRDTMLLVAMKTKDRGHGAFLESPGIYLKTLLLSARAMWSHCALVLLCTSWTAVRCRSGTRVVCWRGES